ncbi:MAG: DMT family transporter [candidate division WOR-3 bacterium]|nr:DMT family transporter [candidate division WOR-3 bacterium]
MNANNGLFSALKNIKAEILLITGTFFWGATFVIVKDIISRTDAYAFLAVRFLIAALLPVPFFISKIRTINRRELISGIILGIVLSGGYIFQTLGLKITSASNTAFITGLSVIIVPLLSAAKLREMPRLNVFAAVITAAVGLYLLTVRNGLHFSQGDILVIFCAFFFALQIVLVSSMTRGASAVNITVIELFTVSVVSFIASLTLGTFQLPPDLKAWAGTLFCALFATTFIFIIQSRYQHYITDYKAAVIYSLEPLFASITAFFVLGEVLGIKGIIGGMLIFAAMLISERSVIRRFRMINH